jgi:hypothetical protein
MGHKKVCFNCKKTFALPTDSNTTFSLTCPECGALTTIFNSKFRPPAKDNLKKWKVVEFLKDHGFVFQHIYKDISKKNGLVSSDNYVDYPTTMEEAKDFVLKYKEQAYDLSKNLTR